MIHSLNTLNSITRLTSPGTIIFIHNMESSQLNIEFLILHFSLISHASKKYITDQDCFYIIDIELKIRADDDDGGEAVRMIV